MSDDPSGHTPVRRSTAGPGEVADTPTDGGAIRIVELTDEDGEPAGLLIEWRHEDDSTWMWADYGAYQQLPL